MNTELKIRLLNSLGMGLWGKVPDSLRAAAIRIENDELYFAFFQMAISLKMLWMHLILRRPWYMGLFLMYQILEKCALKEKIFPRRFP